MCILCKSVPMWMNICLPKSRYMCVCVLYMYKCVYVETSLNQCKNMNDQIKISIRDSQPLLTMTHLPKKTPLLDILKIEHVISWCRSHPRTSNDSMSRSMVYSTNTSFKLQPDTLNLQVSSFCLSNQKEKTSKYLNGNVWLVNLPPPNVPPSRNKGLISPY